MKLTETQTVLLNAVYDITNSADVGVCKVNAQHIAKWGRPMSLRNSECMQGIIPDGEHVGNVHTYVYRIVQGCKLTTYEVLARKGFLQNLGGCYSLTEKGRDFVKKSRGIDPLTVAKEDSDVYTNVVDLVSRGHVLVSLDGSSLDRWGATLPSGFVDAGQESEHIKSWMKAVGRDAAMKAVYAVS